MTRNNAARMTKGSKEHTCPRGDWKSFRFLFQKPMSVGKDADSTRSIYPSSLTSSHDARKGI